MKRIFIIYLIVFGSILTIEAQVPPLQWAKGIGGSGTEYGLSIAHDASGSAYTTGFFASTVDFDPGPSVFNLTSSGFNDIFISKLDASGNFVWAKQIVGTNTSSDFGYDIAIDPLGNVCIAGQFAGTMDFDPGPGTYTLTAGGVADIFILKLDATGNLIWAKNIGSSLGDVGRSIAVESTGNIYTTGFFNSTVDFDPGPGIFNLTSAGNDDVFILKLDASGNFVWARQMGGNSGFGDGAWSLALDGLGNVHTIGSFGGTADFDPGPGLFNLTSQGAFDIFISKLDASGNFIWARSLGTTGTEYGNGIAVDGSGDVYTTGYFGPSMDFDPGPGVFNLTAGGSDIFVSKLNSAGNFVWAKNLGGSGGDVGYSLRVDGSNNVYTTGYFSGTADFDPGPGVFNLTSAGSTDIFVSKLDASGNFVWAAPFSGTSDDEGRDISISSGFILTTGFFAATVDFDPSPGSFTLTSGGNYDIFIHKLANCNSSPTITTAIIGTTSLCSGVGAQGYSVATVSGATSYSWALPGGWSGSSSTNSISATPGSGGIFSVTASNACGTSSAQTLSVTVNSLPTITVNSGSICSGASFTIVPSGASTYTFSSGPIVSPIVTASYSITGTSTAGCVSSNTAVSNVTVNSTPTITVNNGTICNGASFTIVANGANTYTFSTGPVVSPTSNATYSVTGTSTAGCVSSNTAVSNVIVNPLPTIAASSSTNQLCIGNSATLTGSGGATYTWTPGGTGTSIVISPTVNTTYTVIGTNSNSCSNSTVLTQQVISCPTSVQELSLNSMKIYPNPFTDNIMVISPQNETEILVFNMIGDLVFKGTAENGKLEIDLGKEASGVYFIRMKMITKKIIKE
jgi:hypothetical protein